MDKLPNRIEGKKIEKLRRTLQLLGLVYLIFILFSMMKINDMGIGVGTGTLIGFGLECLIGIYIFWVYNSLKNRLGQFIEWTENKVMFKLRSNKNIIEINNVSIKDISYYGDIITIKTDDDKYQLNTEDLGEYRTSIRDNFDKIKKNVPNPRL